MSGSGSNIEVSDLNEQNRLAEMRGSASPQAELQRLRAEVQRLSAEINSSSPSTSVSLRQELAQVSQQLDNLENQIRTQNAPSQSAAYSGASVSPSPYAGATTTGTPSEARYAPTSIVTVPAQGYEPLASAQAQSQPQQSQAPMGLYAAGKALFDQNQYRQAISRFKSYLSEEPKGGDAAAAQFYIGESYYELKQYEDAILEYQKVVRGFPKSTHIAYSLLKQGISFQALGDSDSAKLLYQKVASEHPKSFAAGMAKERLKSI